MSFEEHLHILEPLREVGPEGFKQKSECTYLVRDVENGRDEYMSSQELKLALERGESWEKVYRYKEAGRKLELTKEQAAERGLDPIKDRVRKQSIQETRYINAGWNEQDRAEEWRAQWAGKINHALERAGFEERVDHRSYERQGIERVPMQHEGYQIQAIERRAEREARQQGREYVPVTEIRMSNERIREQNRLLDLVREQIRETERELRAAKEQLLEMAREAKERATALGRDLRRGYERTIDQLRRSLGQERKAELGLERAQGRTEERAMVRAGAKGLGAERKMLKEMREEKQLGIERSRTQGHTKEKAKTRGFEHSYLEELRAEKTLETMPTGRRRDEEERRAGLAERKKLGLAAESRRQQELAAAREAKIQEQSREIARQRERHFAGPQPPAWGQSQSRSMGRSR
jgi:hypothetical protein